MNVLTVLEAGSVTSRCQQVCFLLGPPPWLAGGAFLLMPPGLSFACMCPWCMCLLNHPSPSTVTLGVRLEHVNMDNSVHSTYETYLAPATHDKYTGGNLIIFSSANDEGFVIRKCKRLPQTYMC